MFRFFVCIIRDLAKRLKLQKEITALSSLNLARKSISRSYEKAVKIEGYNVIVNYAAQ